MPRVNEVIKLNEKPLTELVKDARNGSKDAFCTLYGLFKDKLYRYALYRLGDPSKAEDAVSDCILTAWKDIGRLRSDDAFSTWLFRILHNICAGMIRKEMTARENLERVYESAGTYPGRDPVTSIELSEALGRLAEDEREVVLLSVVSDLTSKEISEITGLTPGAVRSKLSRSLSKMRKFLS